MNWISGDWYGLLRPEVAYMALAGAALGAGAAVGFERDRMEKPAGLRTMALVSLGAALFTMLSLLLAGPTGDRGRIAAQIVTGVGFLGAGAIMRGPLGVSGLTTATTVWVVAAIGTVIGAGYGTPGLALSVAVALLLAGVARLERWLIGACDYRAAELSFDRNVHRHHREILSRLADVAGVREIRRESPPAAG